MCLANIRVGFALTGSHCTLAEIMPFLKNLVAEGAEVYPIVSQSVNELTTKYGSAEQWKDMLEEITGKPVINTVVKAEPIGPGKMLDVMIVAPCTGNTLAKLANSIVDGPVLMAAKAQLRNQRPVILAISTNDGLGMNAKNIGLLLNMKNIYLVPFGQDDPQEKPNSLKAKMDLLPATILTALQGRQYQPLLVTYPV
jgi:dipicolinate synthase subunit B